MNNLQVVKLPLLMSVMLNSVHYKLLILKKQTSKTFFSEINLL